MKTFVKNWICRNDIGEITKEQYDSFGSESLDEFANECLYYKHEDKFLFLDS